MQSLEAAACDQPEHLLQQSKSKCKSLSPLFNDKAAADIPFISINQKLRDLYEEECAKDFSKPYKPTRSPSRLLSKLVVREGLSTLLVRLYAGDRGFSVALGGCGGGSRKGGASGTGVVLPYDQNELLRYVDREELPPGLGDLLEKAPSPVFYGGCVIAEVHDLRHCPAGHTRFVLLRPSNQSLLCDINAITRDGDWSPEERMALESQLLQATQGPLCLDPSPSVSMAAIKARHQGLQLNSAPLRRVARKFTQVSVNKKRKLDQYASQCSTPLLHFIQQRKPKTRSVPPPAASATPIQNKPVENGVVSSSPPSGEAVLPPPSQCVPVVNDVLRLARALEPIRQTSDCTPQLAEEYTLETERAQGRVYHIRLSVLQRPSSSEFLGELYVDRDYKEGVKNGASCRFALGTRAHAIRYIQQFTEIFTEEGRKSVRITRIVPGEPNRVTYTGSMREREISRTPAHLVTPNTHQDHLMQVTPNTHQDHLMHSLPPVLQAQAPQQPLVIANSALLAQQLQQSPIASTPGPMQMSPGSLPTSPVKAPQSPTCSNAAINALVTSLMNSAQQFQQKNAMTNNAAVNLLHQHQPKPVTTRKLSGPVQIAPSPLTSQLNSPAQASYPSFTYTLPNKVTRLTSDITNGGVRSEQLQQTSNFGPTMPALSALLANTPSADNPIPGLTSNNSSLLERLTAPQYSPPVSTPSPKQSPMSSPPPTLSFTNLNKELASLQGAIASCPGMENVQLSIPGLSLALNVSSSPLSIQQQGVIVATCQSGVVSSSSFAPPPPPASNMLQAAHNSMLSFPVAQVVTPTMKTALNQSQLRGVVLPQLAPGPQHQPQSLQLVGTLRGTGGQVIQQQGGRGVMRQQTTLKPAAATPSCTPAVVTLNPQQQLQFTVQQKNLQQCLPSSQQQKGVSVKHRRRSSTAEPK